jgi:2-dehydro-3-deoxygalactonokinase
VRALMFPRFLEVLLDTKWYERHLFYEALIAAEDMLAVDQLPAMTGGGIGNHYALVGNGERCRLYQYILKRRNPNAHIQTISDDSEIDQLSITGILSVAKKAGVVK